MKEFKGKVVLITGAAHGVGKETARAFAREGSRLALADIQEERLEETVAEIRDAGHDVIGIPVDLRSRDEVYAMVDRVQAEMGPVDVLINNAGVVHAKKFVETGEQEIEDTIAVNLKAPMWSTKRVLPKMMERRGGHIVNVASVAGKFVLPYLASYCATKFGLVGFTDTIGQEGSRYGIRTTIVNPGWVSSGMFDGARTLPLMTWVTPEYVAGRILEAVKKEKSEIFAPRRMWIGGLIRALLPQAFISWGLKKIGAYGAFKRLEGYEYR